MATVVRDEMTVVNGDGGAPDQKPTKPIPPPESPTASYTRRWVIIAFVAVAILFGLPHWTWTTSIYRAPLPLEAMNAWAHGTGCQPLRFPLHLELTSDDAVIPGLAERLEEDLRQESHGSIFQFHVRTDELPEGFVQTAVGEDDSTPAPALLIHLHVEDSATRPHARLRQWEAVMDVTHAPELGSELAFFIADEVRKVFAYEQASLPHLLKNTPYAQSTRADSPAVSAELTAKRTRAFKYAPTYHLTFSLFSATSQPSQWDISQALERTINPLLARLSPISTFTINTQVQLFASFSPTITGPTLDENSKEWKLQRSDLGGFINAAEWPLSPSIGAEAGPTINFVLYIPSPSQTPLIIADNSGTSWLIPQWGGVQIMNPSSPKDSLLASDLEDVMLTFADQLTSLLGLPPSPSSSLALRIDALARERATSLLLSSSSTLGALARLTLKLPGIAIPQKVSTSVQESIARLESTCAAMNKGQWQEALSHARVAEREAERAFFEPSMVGQVYFPDEHKVAVYVPLLGPMAVPMVLAALKELKKWKQARREKAAKRTGNGREEESKTA